MRDSMPASAPRVGYVLKQYPRLSETFILNELLGLQAHVQPSVYSLRLPSDGRFHPGTAAFTGSVSYVPAVSRSTVFGAFEALERAGVRAKAALDFVSLLPEAYRGSVLSMALHVSSAATEARVDHLHAHFLTIASHVACTAHLLTGIPFSVTAHAKDIYKSGIDWSVVRAVAESARAVVTVCDANSTHLRSKLAGSSVRITRIYNGLPPQPPIPREQDRESDLVLGVGRLVEKKGFDLLLRAAAALRDHGRPVQCVLVGDGDQRASLEALARTLGLDGAVTFTGSLPAHKVAEWMRRAMVVAAPCRIGRDGNQDALPTVLLEALGAGVPAVSTPVAGIPEIIADGVEGLIVPVEDVRSLAAAIGRLLDDRRLWRDLSKAGPIKVARRFDAGDATRALLDVVVPASKRHNVLEAVG